MGKRGRSIGNSVARLFAGAALAVGGAAAVFGSPQPKAAAPVPPLQREAQKPDIVLFLADDLSIEDVGAYGSPDARTPNIDAMAREGLRFDQAFAASPTCSVSRSSILTGLYPMRHGGHANHSPIRDGITTLPTYLKKQGYRVVIAGKTDFGEQSNFPFEYLRTSASGSGLNSRLETGPIDRLLATRDRSKPIALIVASFASHVPWPDNDGFDAGKLTVSPNLYDTPELRKARTRYLSKVAVADRELGDVRRSMAKYGTPGNTLFLFTADQGAQFPFAKWNLYDAGIATPLVAVWPGHVPAGKDSDALVSLVDLLPTMEEVAGGPPIEGIDGVSMVPLLTGKADSIHEQVFATHTGDGSNIAPTRAIRTDRYKLIVNYRSDIKFTDAISENTHKRDNAYWLSWLEAAKVDPVAAAMVNRFYHRVPVELYDIKKDPFELHNLASDPAYQAILKDLRARLEHWMVGQGEKLAKIAMPSDARRGHFPYAQGEPAASSSKKPAKRRKRKKNNEESE